MFHGLRILLRDAASTSIGLIFAINGIVFGSWFVRVPEVQNALGLSEGQLGLSLLGLPLGSLMIMPATGWLIARHGAGRVTLWASIGCCLAIATPPFAGNLWALGLTMVLLGLGNGAMDIAMNAEATAIEGRRRAPIMATCHALYSIGSMIGAGISGLIAASGLPLQIHLGMVALVMIALVLSRSGTLLDSPVAVAMGPAFALPSRPLLGLAIMAFCALLVESAVADWSAVYLHNTLGSGMALAGAGFVGFSLAMTIGRLYGDRLVERWGALAIVRLGALIAAVGLGIGLLMNHPYAAVLGFTCIGIGYAGIVPILFRAAAHTPGMAPGTNIAAVASSGYTGFLAGPALIGFTAEAIGLSGALGIGVLLSLVIAALAARAGIVVRFSG